MASRKLLAVSLGVAAATFSCSSAVSGNCCAYYAEDSGELVDALIDGRSDADAGHDAASDATDATDVPTDSEPEAEASTDATPSDGADGGD